MRNIVFLGLISLFMDVSSEMVKMYPVNRTVWFLKSHENPFLRTHYIFN